MHEKKKLSSKLPPGMAYLSLSNVSKSFSGNSGFLRRKSDPVHAVRNVSLDVESGEILGLVGESGCGKSTLSKLILQLLRPDTGEITLEGENLTSLSASELRKRRCDFQMIFQDPYASLNPRMTVFSTLKEAILVRHPQLATDRPALEQSIRDLMAKVGLDARFLRKYPHEFSGGQRQRIAIARALAPEPKLILADEPVSALDVSIQSQILNLLRHLRDEMSLTMIFVSHDLSVVKYISDRVAVMDAGEIVELGDATEIFTHPRSEMAQKLVASIPTITASS